MVNLAINQLYFMKKYFFYGILILFLSNCSSYQKHNTLIETSLSVKEQLKDIDYLERKLNNIQPNLDAYISKEDLQNKFDSVRKTITIPLKPNEFYFKISPLLASIKQGHNNVSPLYKEYSKKENKKMKKSGTSPISQFDYKWIDEKLYVIKNKSKDSLIKIGTEVLSIENISPNDLLNKFNSGMTSDGFNTTWIPYLFSKRVPTYLFNELGYRDSVSYKFKQNDSVFEKMIVRLKKEDKKVVKYDSIKKDSLQSKKVLTKLERKAAKKKRIAESMYKYNYGYDYTSKEFSKILTFTDTDSSTAVFKIKNFSKGGYKKAYKEVFELLRYKETKNLILDLRDNPGGRLNEIHNLYSYLTAEPNYQLIENARLTSKLSLLKVNYLKGMPKLLYLIAVPTYPIYAGIALLKTKKDDEGYYFKMKSSKTKPNDPFYFNGKIYVLINGGSFSASCILSTKLKQNPEITFVGEETGGDFNGTVAGRVAMQTLPNSKLNVRLWIMKIAATNKTNTIGRGIFPDKEVIPTLEDIMNGNDPELEWIENDIASKK